MRDHDKNPEENRGRDGGAEGRQEPRERAHQKPREKRRSERTRRSDAMFWRHRGAGEFDMGWLLEASDDGFAFAWRGSVLPAEGTLIDVQMCPPGEWHTGLARVRRVEVVHDDLVVIGAEHTSLRPFPPQAEAVEIKIPEGESAETGRELPAAGVVELKRIATTVI